VELSEGNGLLFLVQGVPNLAIAHNTAMAMRGPTASLVFSGDTSAAFRNPGFRFTDNVLTSAVDNWGIYGDGTGRGLASLDVFAPQRTVTGNLFAGTKWGDLGAYALLYPPGNSFVDSPADVGFDSTGWTLRADSPFKGKGANIAAVLAATAHAIDGNAGPTPPPTPPPVVVVTPLTAAQLDAAIAALTKATGSSGRENAATRAALVPVLSYLRQLQAAPAARRAQVRAQSTVRLQVRK
jgi:hypothetical protein